MALDRSSLLPTSPWPIPRRVLCASRPQALSLLTDGGLAAQVAGFTSWPKPNLVKEPYPTVAERLHAGKAAYRAWLKTPEGAGCTYVLPDTSDEEEDDEVEQIMEERIVVRRPLLPSQPRRLFCFARDACSSCWFLSSSIELRVTEFSVASGCMSGRI